MIKKKVCMLGAFAVGKTSLVQQFVNSIFSEKYHTTIGVKIDQKKMNLENKEVNLLLWDIHGEDDYQKVKSSYLKGSSGYILVADGTRHNTLDVARDLKKLADNSIGELPHVLLINKSDLTEEWDFGDNDIDHLKSEGWTVFTTSAKTGHNVEEAFIDLTQKML